MPFDLLFACFLFLTLLLLFILKVPLQFITQLLVSSFFLSSHSILISCLKLSSLSSSCSNLNNGISFWHKTILFQLSYPYVSSSLSSLVVYSPSLSSSSSISHTCLFSSVNPKLSLSNASSYSKSIYLLFSSFLLLSTANSFNASFHSSSVYAFLMHFSISSMCMFSAQNFNFLSFLSLVHFNTPIFSYFLSHTYCCFYCSHYPHPILRSYHSTFYIYS